jgi:hypothetical protein
VGRRGRATACDVHRGAMLGWRLLGLGARRLPPYPLDHLSRFTASWAGSGFRHRRMSGSPRPSS